MTDTTDDGPIAREAIARLREYGALLEAFEVPDDVANRLLAKYADRLREWAFGEIRGVVLEAATIPDTRH